MSRRATSQRILVTASIALLIAACGAGSDSEPAELSDGPAAATTSEAPVITDVMTAVDLGIEPADSLDSALAETPTTTNAFTTTSTTTTTTTGPPPSTSTSVAPSAVCRHDGEWVETTSGRRVLLRTDGLTSPAPTVLVLHGYTGTPTGIERVSNMTVDARDSGVAVAYPEGSQVPVGGLGWNSGAAVFAAVDTPDTDALIEMVEALVATGCVDRERITIAGESNGGGMALAAICSPELSTTFQHAVMVIPAIDAGVLGRCNGAITSSAALTAVAGLADLTAPFDGGNGLLAQLAWFGDVAQRRDCEPTGAPSPLTDTVAAITASECGVCTELLTVADGPHTWPGSPETNGALVAGTFDLNRRIIADLLADDTRCLSGR